MIKYPVALFCAHPEVHFEYSIVTRLARVPLAFILECEQEELIKSRIMLHGKRGLCFADVCKLKMIRHLNQDMGLTLEAVDFVLRYQRQIKILNHQLVKMGERIARKEKAHRDEIRALLQATDLDDP